MIDVFISDAKGRVLDARVEVGDGDIILHSRSGAGEAARNPAYREALETILARLQAEGLKPEVFLDSAPVNQSPLADRRLAEPIELVGAVAEQFNLLIRRSNAGSSSKGAWRRLRLRLPTMPDYALASIIDGSARRRNGMSARQLQAVESEHIRAAIAEVRGGNERPTRFDRATGYALILDDGGPPLPPKKIFGIALAEAHKTYTTPQDFSSGEGIFAILRDRGFRVRALDEREETVGGRSTAPPTLAEVEDAIEDVPITPEERRWIEGNLKFALHLNRERSGLLAQQFKADFRARHGKLFCERCDRDHIEAYGAEIADACFDAHHTVPVAEMDEGHETTPDQLQLLCANCHRVTHREMALARSAAALQCP